MIYTRSDFRELYRYEEMAAHGPNKRKPIYLRTDQEIRAGLGSRRLAQSYDRRVTSITTGLGMHRLQLLLIQKVADPSLLETCILAKDQTSGLAQKQPVRSSKLVT